MSATIRLIAISMIALLFSACGDDTGGQDTDAQDTDAQDAGGDSDTDSDSDTTAPTPTYARFEPQSDAYFDLPFPSDTRLRADGSYGFGDWPGAQGNTILKVWTDAADELVRGWGLVSGVFTWFSAPLDPNSVAQSVNDSVETGTGWPNVFLANVDSDSPGAGTLLPIECEFQRAAGRYSGANQLACVSPFGVLRDPLTTYAFVVTNSVLDAEGNAIEPSPALASLLAGDDIVGAHATIDGGAYAAAAQLLADRGFDTARIAHMDLFTTGDPTARLRQINEFYEALDDPAPNPGSITFVETLDDLVHLEGTYDVPVIQSGARPWAAPPDGVIVFGGDGQPEIQEMETLQFRVTIPRQPMPEGGFPVMMYMHGSGGSSDELLERGPKPDVDTDAPYGSGPGGFVAPYGIAAFATNFALHGRRYSPPDTSGLQLYNITNNPRATVDNFIVGANEVTLHARMLANVVIDPDIAPGVLDAGDAVDGMIRFNPDRISLVGHSMGATIGIPALTISDEINTGVLSGSGGIFVEIIAESRAPIDVAAILVPLMGYGPNDAFDRFDPVAHALQHQWDFVEAVVHARHIVQRPYPGRTAPHVMQPSGIDDLYFSPLSRAALSSAIGADLVTPVQEESAFDLMRWGGRTEALTPPVSANFDGTTTSIVAQYLPEVLDGHNIVFQRADIQAQLACFLRTVSADSAPIWRSVANSQLGTCPD